MTSINLPGEPVECPGGTGPLNLSMPSAPLTSDGTAHAGRPLQYS